MRFGLPRAAMLVLVGSTGSACLDTYPYSMFVNDLCDTRCASWHECGILDESLLDECAQGCTEAMTGATCEGYDAEQAKVCLSDFDTLSCEELEISDPGSCEWACMEGIPGWAP